MNQWKIKKDNFDFVNQNIYVVLYDYILIIIIIVLYSAFSIIQHFSHIMSSSLHYFNLLLSLIFFL
jgi:hypothetical protein